MNLPSTQLREPGHQLDQPALNLLRDTICKEASDDEFKLFVQVAKHSGLDPFARQIHAVKRWDSKAGREVMSIQTSVDGFRLVAQRSGAYEGQTAPQWCGADAVWRDVWLEDEPPAAARVGVRRTGFAEPAWGVARWKSYAQSGKNGLAPLWARMPDVMLAKCAECLALRKAFPQEMHGIYADEEMPVIDPIKPAKEATVTGEVVTKKTKWTPEEVTEGGHLRSLFMPMGGDAWVTHVSKRMGYDKAADVIDTLKNAFGAWTPEQRDEAAGYVEKFNEADAAATLDQYAAKWDWSLPTEVIDSMSALVNRI